MTVTKQRVKLVSAELLLFNANFYQAGPCQRMLETEKIDQILKTGVAVPVVTQRASPIVFFLTKGERSMLCVDYRCLNSVSEKCSYQVL